MGRCLPSCEGLSLRTTLHGGSPSLCSQDLRSPAPADFLAEAATRVSAEHARNLRRRRRRRRNGERRPEKEGEKRTGDENERTSIEICRLKNWIRVRDWGVAAGDLERGRRSDGEGERDYLLLLCRSFQLICLLLRGGDKRGGRHRGK